MNLEQKYKRDYNSFKGSFEDYRQWYFEKNILKYFLIVVSVLFIYKLLV